MAALLACACATSASAFTGTAPTHPRARHGVPAQLVHTAATRPDHAKTAHASAKGARPTRAAAGKGAKASARETQQAHGKTVSGATRGADAKSSKASGNQKAAGSAKAAGNAKASDRDRQAIARAEKLGPAIDRDQPVTASPKHGKTAPAAARPQHGQTAAAPQVRKTKLVRMGKGPHARMVRVTVMVPAPTPANTPHAASRMSRPSHTSQSANSATTLAELAPNKPSYASHPNGVLVLRGTQTPPSFAADQEVAAETPVREETLRGRVKSLLFGPLRGSHESLVRQNTRADSDGSARIEDDDDLQEQIARRRMVYLPESPYLLVDTRLPENRRYTRPWTARFLRDISSAYGERFGSQLVITSAVRTAETQARLIKVNGNAAPVDGETASSHMRGGTIDFGKKGMTGAEINWMRSYLAPLQDSGKIDVAEEFKQACFHVSVYRSYAAVREPKQYVAQDERPPLPTASGGSQ